MCVEIERRYNIEGCKKKYREIKEYVDLINS